MILLMGMDSFGSVFMVALFVLTLLEGSSATLSPSGVNYEGQSFFFFDIFNSCLIVKFPILIFWYGHECICWYVNYINVVGNVSSLRF